MAIEKIKELLKAIKTDPEAQAKLAGLVKGESEDGIVRFYAEAAKLLGFDVSEDELRAAVADAAQGRAEKTEAAAEKVSALADEALEQVAGGNYVYCVSTSGKCNDTYKDKENCWSDDGCDHTVNLYAGYQCENNYAGTTCGNESKYDCSSCIF